MNKAALRAAARWFAQLGSEGITEAERQAWNDWLDAHPDHRWAWRQIEVLQGRMQALPGRLSATTFRIAASSSTDFRPHPLTRRRILKGLGAVLLCGSVAIIGLSRFPLPSVSHYRTAIGERQEIVLADGSRLIVNTDSAVDVAFDADQRLIRLRTGEILIETAADPMAVRRPFIVETAQGRIHALGTRFTVRQYDGLTEVGVLQDAVQIHPFEARWQTPVLRANRQARFSRTEVQAPQDTDESRAAWTHGILVVSDWRLDELAAAIGRYRAGRLVCDPAVAGLRISGAFPTQDTDAALAAIERALPVRVTHRALYRVDIAPRG